MSAQHKGRADLHRAYCGKGFPVKWRTLLGLIGAYQGD
jgi:hypothetical protein